MNGGTACVTVTTGRSRWEHSVVRLSNILDLQLLLMKREIEFFDTGGSADLFVPLCYGHSRSSSEKSS